MQGNPKIKSIGIVSFLVILMAMLGCAEKEIKLPEDKFFAEWETKADTSKGHSPSPVKRTLAVPPSPPESPMAPGSPAAPRLAACQTENFTDDARGRSARRAACPGPGRRSEYHDQ